MPRPRGARISHADEVGPAAARPCSQLLLGDQAACLEQAMAHLERDQVLDQLRNHFARQMVHDGKFWGRQPGIASGMGRTT